LSAVLSTVLLAVVLPTFRRQMRCHCVPLFRVTKFMVMFCVVSEMLMMFC
jgi:hypothetical protein